MEWIKCSDRMPNSGEEALIWGPQIRTMIGLYFKENEEWIESGKFNPEFRKCCITHWMPLPQPPKT